MDSVFVISLRSRMKINLYLFCILLVINSLLNGFGFCNITSLENENKSVFILHSSRLFEL